MEYRILSNNGSLGNTLCGMAVTRVTGGLEAIYEAIGEALQNGFSLVSAPLPANVPLIRSPVRSVIVQKSLRKYDAAGLITLEKAKERSAVLGTIDDPLTRADLEFIDKDQLLRGIAQLEEAAFTACPDTPARVAAGAGGPHSGLSTDRFTIGTG